MIQLTWGHLLDRDFLTSVGKFYAQPMGYEFGMKFAMIGKEVKKQQKQCEEVHEGILKKFGEPDEKRPGFYNIPEAKREIYAEEMKKLGLHKFEIRIEKIDAFKLSETMKLSPQDLMVLEPLLEPLEMDLSQAKERPKPQPVAN